METIKQQTRNMVITSQGQIKVENTPILLVLVIKWVNIFTINLTYEMPW